MKTPTDNSTQRDGLPSNAQGADKRVLYQQELRALGAQLDTSSSVQIRLLEVAGGFVVSSTSAREGETEQSEQLMTHTDLQRMKSGGFLSGRRFGRDSSSVKYEHLLSALGHRLEMDNAYTILLDEVDDSFLVTYQCSVPEVDYMLHKRHVVVNRADVPAMIQSAKADMASR